MSDVPLVPPISLRLSRTLTLDLITSYVATLARAGSMLAIVALLGHRTTTGYLAAFLFLRTLLGFLNNVFVGAGPAAIAALRPSEIFVASEDRDEVAATARCAAGDEQRRPLAYERRLRIAASRGAPTEGWEALFLAGVVPAIIAFLIVLSCVPILKDAASPLVPPSRTEAIGSFAIAFAIGLLARLASDPAGGVLQARRLLWLDNAFITAAEIAWAALALGVATMTTNWQSIFISVGYLYALTGVLLFTARWVFAAFLLVDFTRFTLDLRFDVAARFLAVAGVLALASLGDFLYAPANYLIIRTFLDPLLIADYGPALQVDALLLLAVAALSSVILPRAVALYDAGDFVTLRRAYIAATLVGVLLLAGGAAVTLAFSGPLLEAWLGTVPPGTAAILPWVLVHTVIGGTAGIGRAVLIGMGRLRVYTIATLGAGLLNVVLALLFAVACDLGLRGIVLATIVTVTLRNAVWMPWYVLTRLRSDESRPVPGPTAT